jgi:hypothetical protein
LQLYWRQKVVQHHVNIEMYMVSVAFPLFCPTDMHTRTQSYQKK